MNTSKFALFVLCGLVAGSVFGAKPWDSFPGVLNHPRCAAQIQAAEVGRRTKYESDAEALGIGPGEELEEYIRRRARSRFLQFELQLDHVVLGLAGGIVELAKRFPVLNESAPVDPREVEEDGDEDGPERLLYLLELANTLGDRNPSHVRQLVELRLGLTWFRAELAKEMLALPRVRDGRVVTVGEVMRSDMGLALTASRRAITTVGTSLRAEGIAALTDAFNESARRVLTFDTPEINYDELVERLFASPGIPQIVMAEVAKEEQFRRKYSLGRTVIFVAFLRKLAEAYGVEIPIEPESTSDED